MCNFSACLRKYLPLLQILQLGPDREPTGMCANPPPPGLRWIHSGLRPHPADGAAGLALARQGTGTQGRGAIILPGSMARQAQKSQDPCWDPVKTTRIRSVWLYHIYIYRCVIRAQIFGKPTFFWLTSSFVVNQLVNARLRAPELQGSAAVSDATNNKTKQNKTSSGRK